MDDIRPLLSRFSADCQSVAIEFLGNAGGMSGAQFWRVAAPRGTLMLRRWPRENPTPQRLRFIHAVLRHAAARGIGFLPVPITATGGETFVAHDAALWELTPCLPGVADFRQTPSDEKLSNAMRSLAAFHQAVAGFELPPWIPAGAVTSGNESAITRRLARLQALAGGDAQRLAAAINEPEWPEFASAARLFIAAAQPQLSQALRQLESLAHRHLPLQPCLRDIWHDHVLFENERVTGFVDFGALDVDTPATDVARLLGSLAAAPCGAPAELPRDRLWRTGLAAYAAERPLSFDELQAVDALRAANPIVAGYNWIRWVFVDGREFEIPTHIMARMRQLATELTSTGLSSK